MGLSVRRYRRKVERLWGFSEDERSRALDQFLSRSRPLNSKGEEVTSLKSLRASPSLSKRQFWDQALKSHGRNRKAKFGRHTAGTTGDPTHVSLNRKELGRMLGVRDYCFRHYGLKLGEREARLWGRAETGFKSQVKNFLMNRRIFHPVGPQAESEVVDLVKWRPAYLYGYASLLLEAAKILDRMDLTFEPPKCVVCTAESILPAQKAFISKAFKAPVAEEYGSTEFDVIAFECKKGHRHVVNPWLVVEEGRENGLISDVSRVTQSLIRYELGDFFTIRDSRCGVLGSINFLDQLHGRTIDLFFFVNRNQKVHVISIARLFDRYFIENNDIFSFHIFQNAYSTLDVRIDSLPVAGVDIFQLFLETEISRIAGGNIKVTVSVQQFKETSSKRNYFIQNMSVLE